jgi:predicted metal-dependent phosphoesterase TrpH
MKNFLSKFPDQKILMEMYAKPDILQVNGHVHTPYSFSAFGDIGQIFDMALHENVSVAGINDFFVTDGYEPFCQEALKSGVFPLFNIEFISLLKEEQKQGIRVNDPNNPGRCYFSGKGLNYPFAVEDRIQQKLNRVVAESQDQVRGMIDKANAWFREVNAGITLSYDQIRHRYAKELVRERHIAKAIRVEVFEQNHEDTSRIQKFTGIFGGKAPKSALTDIPGLENEIRGTLLKAGGKAFVEEDDNAFMGLDEVIDIIIQAGGIPCYPVLLDDKNGQYTEFEKDASTLYNKLAQWNIGCIELIPGRNAADHLEKFVSFFDSKGFVILMGTEHNAPDMIPLTCDTRDRRPLSANMQRISWEGACVIAAHQYLNAKELPGFVYTGGKPQNAAREGFIKLGTAVIHYFLQQYKKGH